MNFEQAIHDVRQKYHNTDLFFQVHDQIKHDNERC